MKLQIIDHGHDCVLCSCRNWTAAAATVLPFRVCLMVQYNSTCFACSGLQQQLPFRVCLMVQYNSTCLACTGLQQQLVHGCGHAERRHLPSSRNLVSVLLDGTRCLCVWGWGCACLHARVWLVCYLMAQAACVCEGEGMPACTCMVSVCVCGVCVWVCVCMCVICRVTLVQKRAAHASVCQMQTKFARFSAKAPSHAFVLIWCNLTEDQQLFAQITPLSSRLTAAASHIFERLWFIWIAASLLPKRPSLHDSQRHSLAVWSIYDA